MGRVTEGGGEAGGTGVPSRAWCRSGDVFHQCLARVDPRRHGLALLRLSNALTACFLSSGKGPLSLSQRLW